MIRRPFVLLVFVLTACSQPPAGGELGESDSTPPSSADGAADADGVEGSWVLTAGSVDGIGLEQVADHRITLIIEGTEMGGTAACNQYFARATMGQDGLRMDGGLGSTDMGCRDDVMALEAAYLDALLRVRQLERNEDNLVARGEGVQLQFSALDPPPTAELIDTRWLLDGLVAGDAVAAPMGEPAWIELRSDETFAGATGCRSFSGQWMVRGDQIITPTWGMDETECSQDLQAQDRHVTSVIGDGFQPTVEGDRLTLMDLDGTGLVYRADR
jgi:heat shock protein HslJ